MVKKISFKICAFGICWWPNSAYLLNKNEVEHLSELKCILGMQKITDFIPEMNYYGMIMQKRWAD